MKKQQNKKAALTKYIRKVVREELKKMFVEYNIINPNNQQQPQNQKPFGSSLKSALSNLDNSLDGQTEQEQKQLFRQEMKKKYNLAESSFNTGNASINNILHRKMTNMDARPMPRESSLYGEMHEQPNMYQFAPQMPHMPSNIASNTYMQNIGEMYTEEEIGMQHSSIPNSPFVSSAGGAGFDASLAPHTSPVNMPIPNAPKTLPSELANIRGSAPASVQIDSVSLLKHPQQQPQIENAAPQANQPSFLQKDYRDLMEKLNK